MKIRCLNIVDECFQDYVKTSMLVSFPECSGKCWKELGLAPEVCHNYFYYNMIGQMYDTEEIVKRYMKNNITSAIILGGLEPLDSFDDLISLVTEFRKQCDDDIVIYTGYNEEEVIHHVTTLKPFTNIIMKFGRYIPNRETKYDEILGVYLPSDNQYAKRIC